jgi:hypothetical protein
MILDYNKTKGGVDHSDKIVKTYTVKRSTQTWPLANFYNLADTSAYNATVIYFSTFSKLKKKRQRKAVSCIGPLRRRDRGSCWLR